MRFPLCFALLYMQSLSCHAQESAPPLDQLNTLPEYVTGPAAEPDFDTQLLNRDARIISAPMGAPPRPDIATWATVSVVVTPQGDTDNVVILDSSGSESFDRHIISTAKQWRWEPALRSGEPVAQHVAPQTLKVVVRQSRGRKGFIAAYDKVSAAIAAGSMDAARAELQELLSNDTQSTWESAWLGWLHYGYLRASPGSDDLDLISSLQRAVLAGDSRAGAPPPIEPRTGTQRLEGFPREVDDGGRYLTPHLTPHDYVSALTALFILRLKAAHFVGAVDAYQQLRGLSENRAFSEQRDSIDALLKQFEPGYQAAQATLRDSNKALQMRGKTEASGYWTQRLSRPSVRVAAEQGLLEALELRCEAHFSRSEFEEDGPVFAVAAEWGDCFLYVQGEPGATFKVLQR